MEQLMPTLFSKTARVFFSAILGLVLVSAPSNADEGMWPFNHLPLEQIKKLHGADLDSRFVDRLQRGSVRFNNGGSASFVSPHGLVMTNHHVASDCIKKLSSKEKDYIKDGFYAAEQAAELKCPDLEINVLMSIETVTDRINAKVTEGMAEKDRFEAQRAATAEVEKACNDETGLRCDVVKLYEGGIFDLYRYKRYTDVRLAFAPEFLAAFFGGDPDNFTYPRYCMDVSFLRVYQDDKPIASPAYLPWSKNGAAANEVVFVSGHPGSTNRLLTEAQLRFEAEQRVPFMLDWLHGMAKGVRAFGERDEESARLARDELFRFDNSIKAYTGMYGGLKDPKLLAAKAASETKLRNSIKSDPEKQKQFGAAWDEIAAAQKVKRSIHDEYRLLGSLGFFSRYITIARHLYRLSEELPKPNTERLPEYNEAGLESLYQQIYSPAPIYDDAEIVKLTQSLTFLKQRLGEQHPVVKQVLGSRTPEDVARGLITATKLKDVDFRKELGADQAKKAGASEDPMIELVRSIDKADRKVRKQYEDEVEAIEDAHGSRIAQAQFAALGTAAYPDATFTLRLAVGVVKSYQEAGKTIAPFTKFGGLYEKATDSDPYILPENYKARKDKVNLDTPYNLVSTNDITGGNSGSPLVNKRAEVVGIIFDGNIQSLPNSFLYSETQARAVSVDSRGIMEALKNVYQAERIVSELQPNQ
jgi:hypothetical protein